MFLHAEGTAAAVPMNLHLTIFREGGFLAFWVHELYGAGPFPGVSGAFGKLINAIRPEKIARRQRQGQRGQGMEGFQRGIAGLGGIDHVGVHFIIARHRATDFRIGAPGRGPTGRAGRLLDGEGWKHVGLGVGVPGNIAGEKRRSPQAGGFCDGKRPGIDRSGGRGRHRAIQGIADFRTGRLTGDRSGDRGVIEAAIHTEFSIPDPSRKTRGIRGSGRGRGEKQRGHRRSARPIHLEIHQEIAVIRVRIESMNREDIGSREQQSRRDQDDDFLHRRGFRSSAGSGGDAVPCPIRGRIPAGDQLTIEIRDEAVVITHLEFQLLENGWIRYAEGRPQQDTAGLRPHGGGEIRGNQSGIP